MWDPQILCRAVDLIRILGLTINEGTSVLSPTKKLVYLVITIDTGRMLTLAGNDRLFCLHRYTRQGSLKDVQRVEGFAQLILFNLRLPYFLARDVLLEDLA